MTDYKNFSVDIDDNGIAVATIDVPNQSMNVWTADFIREAESFVEEFISNDDIKGLIWASGKANGFMAGADLNMLADWSGEPTKENFENIFKLNKIFRRMETGGLTTREMTREGKMAKPVAAAIEGLALGGGLEICLASHYRVVANNPKIQLGLPEALVGVLPGAGGTQRSMRLLGLQNAAIMCTQGKSLNPSKALAQGLVNEVVEPGKTIEAAKAWIAENPTALAPWDKKGFKIPGGGGAMHPGAIQFFTGANAMITKETRQNYPAIKYILSCFYEGSIVDMNTAIRIESKYMMKLLGNPACRNMIRTLFINKQAAEKGAARPAHIEKSVINKVGVLGAGLMGSGITHVSVKGGMDVVVLDRSAEEAQKAVEYSRKILAKKVSRGRMTEDSMEAFLAKITPTTDYSDLKDVDLIIEAVFERPDVKADVIKKTEAVIGEDVIFASNTSTLPIGDLAENSVRPEQFIGMHFFSPVEKMPLLEIIPHETTGDKALAVAFDYNRKIKKTPIVVKDVRGFFTNQVFPPYVDEAIHMVMEGINPALIENCAMDLGLPIGPLALLDETTLRLGYDVMKSTMEGLGEGYIPTGTEEFYDLMVNKIDRAGRRFGAGFYNYSEDGKRLELWKGMVDHYPLKDDQPDADTVKRRLMFAQLVPTANCYADGVVFDPQSADLGAIFGWGFPPWTGGPLSYIDTIGLTAFVETADMLTQKHGHRFTPPAAFREWARQGETLYGSAEAKAEAA